MKTKGYVKMMASTGSHRCRWPMWMCVHYLQDDISSNTKLPSSLNCLLCFYFCLRIQATPFNAWFGVWRFVGTFVHIRSLCRYTPWEPPRQRLSPERAQCSRNELPTKLKKQKVHHMLSLDKFCALQNQQTQGQ